MVQINSQMSSPGTHQQDWMSVTVLLNSNDGQAYRVMSVSSHRAVCVQVTCGFLQTFISKGLLGNGGLISHVDRIA